MITDISITEKVSDLEKYEDAYMLLWVAPGSDKPYWADEPRSIHDEAVASPDDFLEAGDYESGDYSDSDAVITLVIERLDLV
jgi:hypothetical protein